MSEEISRKLVDLEQELSTMLQKRLVPLDEFEGAPVRVYPIQFQFPTPEDSAIEHLLITDGIKFALISGYNEGYDEDPDPALLVRDSGRRFKLHKHEDLPLLQQMANFGLLSKQEADCFRQFLQLQ